MTPALEHFELLAEAGGLEKLRELILELAVGGRLLPSDTSQWVQTRLGELIHFTYGKALPERARNPAGQVPVYGSNGVVGRHDQALVQEPCLVVGRKGSVGSIHCVTEPCWPIDTAYYVKAPPEVELPFLSVLLQSLKLERLGRAISIPGLNRNDAYALTVRLPPLDEQHRIVAKVDALMQRVADWESRRAKQQALRARLRASVLDALVTAREPEAFSAAWREALDHFEALFQQPEDIQHLRELVLHAAMRGVLTPSEPEDGSADTLLHLLDSERKRLRASLRVKEPHLPPISPDEEPYPLPSSWRWCRLGYLGGLLGGGTPSKADGSLWSGSIPWVSPKDMKRSHLDDAEDHLSEAAIEQSALRRIPSGSLLFVVRGMILAHSFPVALTTREVTINQDLKGLVPALAETAPYLLWAIKAARARILQHVERSSHGTCRLDTRKVLETPIALPPLSEQRRILDTLESLTKRCDELELRLRQAGHAASKLTETLVATLITP